MSEPSLAIGKRHPPDSGLGCGLGHLPNGDPHELPKTLFLRMSFQVKDAWRKSQTVNQSNALNSPLLAAQGYGNDLLQISHSSNMR